MIRESNRDSRRIEMEAKRMKKQLEKMVKKGEPKSSQRIIASNYLKKQKMINKYKGMAAKMEGVKIQIAGISTTQTLVETMSKMAHIMGKTSESVNINNIQGTITQFNMALEKQTAMGELVEDAMDMDEDDIDDADADALIDDIEGGIGGGGKKEVIGKEDTLTDELAGLR